ncbi:MAG TPA: uroporphyrinogen-III synthase [Ardenticatenaceae bacterium]|nr:uroporphyrinogen-III synthase [Ardenticatenaceae bacterium]
MSASTELGVSPLAGRRVLVTRPEEQAGAFVRRLREVGAEPVLMPTIRIVPPEEGGGLDAAIERLGQYAWVIFTSVNGVRFFFERLERRGQSATALSQARVAAIGPATAQALTERGVAPHFVPTEYVAEAIVAGIGEVTGQCILLPRADIARKALVEGLQAKGAAVDEVVAYRTAPARTNAGALEDLTAGIDVATFTSPSTVRNFMALFEGEPPKQILGDAIVACIGPITAQAAREAGYDVDVVAEDYTIDGLLHAIVKYFKAREPSSLPRVSEPAGGSSRAGEER